MPKPVKAELTSRRVVGLLTDLDYDREGQSVTLEDLAKYAQAPATHLAELCRELEARRIIKRITRKKREIFVPWRGQRA